MTSVNGGDSAARGRVKLAVRATMNCESRRYKLLKKRPALDQRAICERERRVRASHKRAAASLIHDTATPQADVIERGRPAVLDLDAARPEVRVKSRAHASTREDEMDRVDDDRNAGKREGRAGRHEERDC